MDTTTKNVNKHTKGIAGRHNKVVIYMQHLRKKLQFYLCIWQSSWSENNKQYYVSLLMTKHWGWLEEIDSISCAQQSLEKRKISVAITSFQYKWRNLGSAYTIGQISSYFSHRGSTSLHTRLGGWNGWRTLSSEQGSCTRRSPCGCWGWSLGAQVQAAPSLTVISLPPTCRWLNLHTHG